MGTREREGCPVAEHDRAVPCEDERELATVKDEADRVGQRERVGGDRVRVEHQRRRVAGGVERRRLDSAGPAGA